MPRTGVTVSVRRRIIGRLLAAAATLLVATVLVLPAAPAAAAPSFVGSAVRSDRLGHWLVSSSGAVSVYGKAAHLGDMAGRPLNQPIVGMASTPSNNGYWLVASDGGIFSYGDARFFGSTGSIRLNQPIVGMASTPSNNGYWLVASDGGIFSYGDARFFGSTGSIRLNQPIVGMSPTAGGAGYWMAASDGGIFAFGDAKFYGSTGSTRLNQPITGMATSSTGKGYWLAAADGGVFSFGDATFRGAGTLAQRAIAIIRDNNGGYSVVGSDGSVANRTAPVTTPTTRVPETTTTTTRVPVTAAPTTSTTPVPVTSAPVTTTTRVPVTTTTTAPSAGNGWNLVAKDDFDGNTLNTRVWTPYNSVGHGGVGLRRPEAITVGDGELRITGDKNNVSGGMCWCGPDTRKQTYGRWEVRARMDKGNGYSGVALLWPTSGRWPVDGEIDITELVFGDRKDSYFNLHYGSDNKVIGHSSQADFTQWHTFTVDWEPNAIRYYMDGKLEFTVTNPDAIPRNPMHMTLQNDMGITPRDATSPDKVTYHVDYIRIYSR